jgi:ribose transport system permease protein
MLLERLVDKHVQAPAEEGAWRFPLSRELALGVVICAAAAVASYLFPAFATFENFSAILRNLALDAILATGMMLLLIGGSFDLSIGGTFSMVGVVTGWLLKSAGVPVPLAIALGLALGASCGLLNGFIVAKVKVNALIATLGTMQIFRGVAVLVGGPGINFLPQSFSGLAQSNIMGIQAPVWLMAFVVLMFHFLLTRTRFFRQYYYIGGNARAARLCGMPVERKRMLAFTIMGLLAGLAGMTFAARLGTSVSIAGDGAELRIITAAILGGASLTGGKGTIWGALVGVVFIALTNNIMIIAQVPSYWQSIVIGLVLVVAVAMDYFVRREA